MGLPGDRWRFMVEDPLTGRIIDNDLPLVGARVTDLLNRPGAIVGQLPLASDHATAEIIAPGRRAIYALRDGVIQQGGPLWSADVREGDDHVEISCDGWLGYWDHRDIWTSATFQDVEQFDIFAQLIADAQDDTDALVPGASGEGQVDLGITVVWTTPSGRLRTRLDQYADHQSKNLGDALRELAGVRNGFDFGMEYTLTDTEIGKAIRLYFPTRGRDLRNDRSHQFEFEYDTSPTAKTNILTRGVSHSADDMAWRIRGWGEGNGPDRTRSQVVDHTAGAGYLPLDGSPTWSTVSQSGTLEGHTAAYAARQARPLRLPHITVDADRDPLWGTYGLGDVLPLSIRDQSPLGSYEGPARLIGWSIDTDLDRPTLSLEPV